MCDFANLSVWPSSKWHFHPDVSICMYPPQRPPDEMQAAGDVLVSYSV